ncbi:hypothetical protein AN639_12955 [Candidatus Epulonipiscium fishelsonii]|uniref:Uncharacterized protein n=1 Tax=Candidatus Epulonipiscium fishelsonii TaxID=77094 RepID=A0ACC8X997_9FIRM|nr:hypothetical protein AN396_10700 [Epulopiscium sp. SCG-B11WGA-EpuloA1]ONI42121.1 hypothetical protein AN639_12955 [Epulopiscium sp. SCG-B05WGA-EpuloA1]
MKQTEIIESYRNYMKDRIGIYMFFRDAFFVKPSEELVDKIKNIYLNNVEGEDIFDWEEPLFELSKMLNQDDNIKLDELKAEYTYLFIGPKKIPAPIFESVYHSDKRLLFTENTIDVRKIYQKSGLEVLRKNQIPDDHLAYEMEFMYYLAHKIESDITNENLESKVVATSKSFLEKHLLKWVPTFCANVEQYGESEFYKKICSSLLKFLVFDNDMLI